MGRVPNLSPAVWTGRNRRLYICCRKPCRHRACCKVAGAHEYALKLRRSVNAATLAQTLLHPVGQRAGEFIVEFQGPFGHERIITMIHGRTTCCWAWAAWSWLTIPTPRPLFGDGVLNQNQRRYEEEDAAQNIRATVLGGLPPDRWLGSRGSPPRSKFACTPGRIPPAFGAVGSHNIHFKRC